MDSPWGIAAELIYEPIPGQQGLIRDYKKYACCWMKDSGRGQWAQPVPCGASETPFGCCLRAAAGIFNSFEVIKARRGMCGFVNIRPAEAPLHGFPPLFIPAGSGGGIATRPLPLRAPANPSPGTCTQTGRWPWTQPRDPVPIPIDPRNRKGEWTCDAKGATRGGRNYPANCPEWLYGTGSGRTKQDACTAAKKDANHNEPGCWAGHLRCLNCKQN